MKGFGSVVYFDSWGGWLMREGDGDGGGWGTFHVLDGNISVMVFMSAKSQQEGRVRIVVGSTVTSVTLKNILSYTLPFLAKQHNFGANIFHKRKYS